MPQHVLLYEYPRRMLCAPVYLRMKKERKKRQIKMKLWRESQLINEVPFFLFKSSVPLSLSVSPSGPDSNINESITEYCLNLRVFNFSQSWKFSGCDNTAVISHPVKLLE